MLKRIYHSSRSVSKENPARGRVIYTSVVDHPGQLSNFYRIYFISLMYSKTCVSPGNCSLRISAAFKKKKESKVLEISTYVVSHRYIGKTSISRENGILSNFLIFTKNIL